MWGRAMGRKAEGISEQFPRTGVAEGGLGHRWLCLDPLPSLCSLLNAIEMLATAWTCSCFDTIFDNADAALTVALCL